MVCCDNVHNVIFDFSRLNLVVSMLEPCVKNENIFCWGFKQWNIAILGALAFPLLKLKLSDNRHWENPLCKSISDATNSQESIHLHLHLYSSIIVFPKSTELRQSYPKFINLFPFYNFLYFPCCSKFGANQMLNELSQAAGLKFSLNIDFSSIILEEISFIIKISCNFVAFLKPNVERTVASRLP